jgi:hypothetical protein
MRSAVMVVHGPEAFDQGDVAWLLSHVRPSRVIVAGVMARTAAEESGLCVEFDGRPPSHVILDTPGPVFLCNRGKTPHSGRVFGGIVASRLSMRGLVHVECSSGTVYSWNGGDPLLAAGLAKITGYSPEEAASTDAPQEGRRQIRGCIPGEPVYVNGIVIGRATAETVVLKRAGGSIVAVSGIELKPHGMEKLIRRGIPDIGTAWCKSGIVRSQGAKNAIRACRRGKVLTIDHCGHEIYARMGGDCCGVLAIGDDTTAVCGHICLHRGIPVLGITDHDCDTILLSAFAPGSVVLETRPERDDDVGSEIAASVSEYAVCWDDWVQDVLERFAGRVTVTLDLREVRP